MGRGPETQSDPGSRQRAEAPKGVVMAFLAFALNVAALTFAIRVALERGLTAGTVINEYLCTIGLVILWPSVRSRLRR
jgi:ligand-binding SRPBCC domain-containing protein